MAGDLLIDCRSRVISYLRISITDRCNLRCMYCVGEEEFEYIPHKEILTYEEILRLVRLFVQRGIRKIRVTGGEPLVRKGVMEFLSRLTAVEKLEETALTTNGVLLDYHAQSLKAVGINRLNISLDTLKPEKYLRITGRDSFQKVWNGIQTARELGFDPIKLNVVAIRGVNDDEILDFARLAMETPLHVRFIEFMPIGKNTPWKREAFLSMGEVQRTIEERFPLEPVASGITEGPARKFKPRGGAGEIGFIGAITRHFCDTCNRLRLTAAGGLRPCLLSDREFDLKSVIRGGGDDDALVRVMEEAVRHKNSRHRIDEEGNHPSGRLMVGIGG